MKNNTIIIAGISASGKDTLARELERARNEIMAVRAITATTRPMGENEKEGIDYYYISNEAFDRITDQGGFAETAQYNVCGETWKYGSFLKDYNIDDGLKRIFILNPYGIRQLREKGIEFTLVYVKIPFSTAYDRMKLRGRQSDTQMARRIAQDADDFANFEQEFFPDIVLDGTADRASVLTALIEKLKCMDSSGVKVKTAHKNPTSRFAEDLKCIEDEVNLLTSAEFASFPKKDETIKLLLDEFVTCLFEYNDAERRSRFRQLISEINELENWLDKMPIDLTLGQVLILEHAVEAEVSKLKAECKALGYSPNSINWPASPLKRWNKHISK